VYLFFAWFLEVPETLIVLNLMRRFKMRKVTVVIDTSQEVVEQVK
jgi:hypothetical protein